MEGENGMVKGYKRAKKLSIRRSLPLRWLSLSAFGDVPPHPVRAHTESIVLEPKGWDRGF